ncbi:MAG: hypothetical protein HY747_10240 [Elusimicrobia bacterium]|nr:hypothetical protein [Elusimicrobiota bacterium]
MPVIIPGTCWPHLTERLSIEIIKSRKNEIHYFLSPLIPSLVAVPSQAARYWLLKELSLRLDNDLAGINVMTLHQMALESFRYCGKATPQVTEDRRYLAATWKLLASPKHSAHFTHPKNDPYPTARAIYTTIRELRDAGINAKETAWLGSEEPYEGLTAREISKTRQIFSLYGGYVRLLKKNRWIDGPQMLMEAAAALEQDAARGRHGDTGTRRHGDAFSNLRVSASPRHRVLLSASLYVWGFAELTGVQKIFIRGLAKWARSLTFFLPEDDSTKPLADEMVGWGFFRTKAAESMSGGEYESKSVGTKERTGEKTKNVHTLAHSAARPLCRSAVISCPTPQEEAWAAAKYLKHWHAQGAPWHECAVIMREPGAYVPFLKKAFMENAVPFVCMEDPGETLGKKPLGAALAAALDFWVKPNAARALNILNRPAASCPADLAGLVKPILARLLSLSPKTRLKIMRSGQALRVIKKFISFDRNCLKKSENALAVETLKWLKLTSQNRQSGGQARPNDLWSWLSQIVPEPQDTARDSGPISVPEALRSGKVLRQAYLDFKNLIANLPAAALKSRAFAAELLKEALSAAELAAGNLPANSGGVWLVTANQARGGRWKKIIILNAADGAWPIESSEDPFLSDAARQRLSRLGFAAGPRQTRAAAEEKLLFKLIVSSAGENILLTYPQTDSAGKPAMASPYIEMFRPQPAVKNLSSDSWQDKIAFLQDTVGLDVLTDQEIRLLNRQDEEPKPSRSLITMKKEDWTRWLNEKKRISPTMLSDFLSCPQAFFLKYVLKTPGASSEPAAEFYPASFLRDAFSKTVAMGLAKKNSRWPSLFRQELRKAFPAVEYDDLAPAERYKLDKIASVKAEEELDFTFGPNNEKLFCRADLLIQDRIYAELKLKKRSAFGKATGARLQPHEMLEKLLDPDTSEGPRFGLQIMFYLLHAQGNGVRSSFVPSAEGTARWTVIPAQAGIQINEDLTPLPTPLPVVMLVNPYWETTDIRPPFIYSWKSSDLKPSQKERLAQWLNLLREGISAGQEEIAFPFWPHENFGGRCSFCPWHDLCLKDVGSIRRQYEVYTESLKAAFQKNNNEDDR